MPGRTRVLVTRPEPGASETTQRLESLGFDPIRLPLQETRPVPVALAAALLHGVVAVAVPSASAVRHAPDDLLRQWSGLPCFAVGEATAQVARAAGFAHVIVAQGDAESLADLVISDAPAGKVAYLCGKVRRPLFESTLRKAGVPVLTLETYDTLMLDLDTGAISSGIGKSAVDCALVYSANAAARLAEIVQASDLQDRFDGTIFLCISDRVSKELAGAGRKILVAEEPNETAMLKVLHGAVRPAS